MGSAPLLDFIASAQARDDGMSRVIDNNDEWMRISLLQIEQFVRSPQGWANVEHGVIGEDIRVMVIKHCGHPSTPKAWGGLILKAIHAKLLIPTGRYRSMKAVKSHARKTPIYSLGVVA